ncbi:hypothetical protein CTI12_AA115600 [Artemisia annua]|uniref:Uncharacterized protein n=1 Tax=Artemisia annua TaxID=35608 RepID=A0A2U1PTA2_ARTAN|nr:hypothetical protein CTI12_AA115600 [Artemisia annua]
MTRRIIIPSSGRIGAKKRGRGSSISNQYNEPTKIVWEENKIKEMSSADEDKVNLGKEEGNMYEFEVSKVRPTKLKYDDDNDDYNDKKGKMGKNGKKRRGKGYSFQRSQLQRPSSSCEATNSF